MRRRSRSRDVEDAGKQPAGARHDGTPWLDGQAQRHGRRPAPPAPRPRPPRNGPVSAQPASRTGKPDPTSSVSKSSSRARCRRSVARPIRKAVRQASTAPSWDPTWTCRPRQRRGPSGPPPASMTSASSSSVTPNFESPAPTARPRMRLRADRRVETDQHVEAQVIRARESCDCRRRRGSASAAASSADSIASQRNGVPAAASRTARRRSAGVLPMPSSAMVSTAKPARRGERDLAARDGTGAEATTGQLRDERRQAIGLQRVEPNPWIGKGCAELIGIGPQARQVVEVGRRAPAAGGRSGGGREAGRGSSRTAPSVADDEREEGRDDGQQDGAQRGGDERVDREGLGRPAGDAGCRARSGHRPRPGGRAGRR